MPKYKARRQSASSSAPVPPNPLGNSPTQPQWKPQTPRLHPATPLGTSISPLAGPSSYPTTADLAIATTSDSGSTSFKELRESQLVIGSFHKNDLKQKLAKQRREEMNKQHEVNTEKNFLEKERKAKLQFEKWMENKQQKMKEQKEKDEQRRMSVESNRKLKLEQEMERYKAAVNRTMERTNRLDQQGKKWSWDSSMLNTDFRSEHRKSLSISGKENKPHSCLDKEGSDNNQGN